MLVEKSNFTVTRMVRLLGVSRSGFYAWLGRVPSKSPIRTERIEAKVAWFHGDSDEVSGSPRILADLRDDGGHLPQDRRQDDAQAGCGWRVPTRGGRPRSSTTPTPTPSTP
jgi:hypothetical protein